MYRSTWALLMAGLLVATLQFAFAPEARADDLYGLGEPPAGVVAQAEPEVEEEWPVTPVPAEIEDFDVEIASPPTIDYPGKPLPVVEEAAVAVPAVPSTEVDPYDPELPLAPMPVARSFENEGFYAARSTVLVTPSPCAPMVKKSCGPCRPRCMTRWTILVEGTGTCIGNLCGKLGESVPAGTPQFDWGENDYCIAYGGRLTVSFQHSQTGRLELRGGYLGKWDASSNQTGAFGYSPPPGSVSTVGTAVLESEAELWGGEFNHWWTVCKRRKTRFELGLGMRYIRFDETASLSGFPLAAQGGTASLASDVRSQMLAAQLGAGAYWNVSRRFELGLIGKALAGGVSRKSDVVDVSMLSGGTNFSSARENEFGWGFELEGRALFRLTRNIGLSAGAAMLYMGETNRAHEAFDFTQAGTGAVQAKIGEDDLLAITFLLGLQLDF